MKKKYIIGGILLLVLVGSAYFALKPKTDIPDKIIKQNTQEQKWLDKLDTGDYTIDNPYIIQNPYDANELSAYVAFKSDKAVTYTYTVNGDIPFTYTSDKVSRNVIIPVAGLYYNTDNKVDITIKDKKGNSVDKTTVTIDTTNTDITKDLSTADVTVEDDNSFDEFMDGRFFIDNYTNVYDADGNLRAANIAPDSNYAYLKIFNNQFFVPVKSDSDGEHDLLLSYSLIGRINPDVYYHAPPGMKFHHDFTMVGNKLYAFTSSVSDDSGYADSYTESLITVYNKNGSINKIIDMSDFYNVDSEDSANKGANADDLHLNSIDYYEPENLLIIDSRTFSQIIGYSLDTNQVEWIIDDPDTVGDDHKDLLLKNIGDMEYASGEHAVFVANDYIPKDQYEEGKLYLSIFDNRQCLDENNKEITKDLSAEDDADACTSYTDHTVKSRGLVYEIDLENKTVKQIDAIDFNSYTGYKGGFNMLANGYKTAYIANAHKFEIYNEDDKLVGYYTLHTTEEALSEDVPFLYRAVSFTTEDMQNFVEINK